jgi:hypothetical protein
MVEIDGRQGTGTDRNTKPNSSEATSTDKLDPKMTVSGSPNGPGKSGTSKGRARSASKTTTKRTTASRKHTSRSKAPSQKPARSRTTKQGVIILPAIKGEKDSKTTKKRTASKSRKTASSARRQPPSNTQKEQMPQKPVPAIGKSVTAASQPSVGQESLPLYQSRTNGLKELLSAIDPDDKSYQLRALSADTSIAETSMFIPDTRPGIPGSPDLPVGPTRWGFYLSLGMVAIFMVFVSALVYSHLSSPTGINWTKLQTRTIEAYQWIVAKADGDETHETAGTKVVKNNAGTSGSTALANPGAEQPNGTKIATASRISTTAASPKRGTITPPAANEIFISAEELENQIRALEGKANSLDAKEPETVSETDLQEFENRQEKWSVNIDAKTENQIFARARSYLKQRDISSARMILQYAATLGSGISAMALAETFDPHYLKKVNLHGVAASPSDARKWYKVAANLGVKEARRRLTALK